jgi:hypothetical protein
MSCFLFYEIKWWCGEILSIPEATSGSSGTKLYIMNFFYTMVVACDVIMWNMKKNDFNCHDFKT